MNVFLWCFKPKFYKKSKSTTNHIKNRLDRVRKKRIARVNFLKMDIVDLLKIGLDYNAYTRAEELLEQLRILSCYDVIERFCDCISENLPLMLNKTECPEECREAVSSLIYAAAWVPDVPELKDIRAVFTQRFGNFTHSSVNHELVEKTELRRRPSRELKIQTVKDIAKEFSINWDSTAINLMLLRQTSALQTEDKAEAERAKSIIIDDRSDDESIFSQSWRRDSLSKDSLSSSSSSSSGSLRMRESAKNKKILPYGIISPPYKKPGDRNDEKEQEEKEEKKKSVAQGSSRLRLPQGINKEEETSSFQRPKFVDYDEVVARLAALRKKEEEN